jgi:hypothetical protein
VRVRRRQLCACQAPCAQPLFLAQIGNAVALIGRPIPKHQHATAPQHTAPAFIKRNVTTNQLREVASEASWLSGVSVVFERAAVIM